MSRREIAQRLCWLAVAGLLLAACTPGPPPRGLAVTTFAGMGKVGPLGSLFTGW
ncbi:MAG: hypothetical protein GX605_11975 [Chloroflexi bacterium]|nr:hypothetical protein [Chloroflexota bacterium]